MDGSSPSSVSSAEKQVSAKRSFSVRRDAMVSGTKPPPAPQVATRDNFDSAINLLGHDQVEKFHDKLVWVSDQWSAELDKLEAVLGTDAFKELLRALDKETAPELVDLRDRAYALKEILASRPIQNVLHSKVRRMDKWDANSRAVLDLVRPQQQGDNLMSARKQSAIYYAWSVASAARASTFVASMYSASKVLTALSVTCTAAVPLLAIFHTVTMIRDLYRTEESFYSERAKAYGNMDQALMFMKNIGNPSLADAGGVLLFLDACKKIPELSPTAKLEADKTHYAAMRERYFLPVNLLASATAQILNSLGTSPIGGTVLFGLSGFAYLGQAYCDWKQGDSEKHKADDLRVFAQKWIDSLDNDLLKTWRAENTGNDSLCDVLLHHMERISGQQGLEVAGGVARKIKAGANLVSASGSLTVAALLQARTVYKPSPANVVGTFISAASTTYMAFTATKMYRRGDALVDSKHRREDTRLLEAMFDLEKVRDMMGGRNQKVILRVPAGIYDERTGFQTTRREVSPFTNEHLAVGVIAHQLARLTDPKLAMPENHGEILNVLQHVWKMQLIELWAMLMVAKGMQDDHRRLDFLRHRLAPLFKTDYPLMADIQRAAPLAAEVVVDRAIHHVSQQKSFKSKINGFGDSNRTSEKHRQLAKRLYDGLRADGFFGNFNEDDFVAAIDQVWSQRREATGAYDARAKLYQVRLVADHIVRAREQCGVDITRKMRKTDAALLQKDFSEQEVSGFREQLRLYLNAQVLVDRKAKAMAALNLSRMSLVQRLIRESKSDDSGEGLLFFKLQCGDELKPILDRLDIDQTIEKVDDPDDIIITLSDSDEFDSESDADNDFGNDRTLVINIEGKLKGTGSNDSDTDTKVSTEDSMSENAGAAPIFTPRQRGRIVQRIFDKEALRRDKLLGEFENALTYRGNGDDDVPDVLSSSTNTSADGDQNHMNDRY